AFGTRIADRQLGALPYYIQLALKRQLARHAGPAPDEHLTDERLHGLGRFAELLVIGRHRPPTDQLLSFLADDRLEDALLRLAHLLILRQEQHADSVVAFAWQRRLLLLH